MKTAAKGRAGAGRRVGQVVVGLTLAICFLWGAGLAWAGEEAPVLRYCYQGQVPETRLVVVDKSRQRIMVLRYMGQLMLEQEFPCATGANPGPKVAEGDERTPVGVYFTTHRYQDKKITIFGDRAIHMNYPNPFDLTHGRQGNGIYIHGTNQKLKPRSSNGCITLRNQDLAQLEPLVREQLTPVVVVERLNLEPLDGRVATCELLKRLEARPPQEADAAQKPYLSLAESGQKHRKRLDGLAPRLAGLAPGGKLGRENLGFVLIGLGEQWVLVADQMFRGPGRKKARASRRYYLAGPDPTTARLLRADWVVPTLPTARRLASWAPKPRTKAPPAPQPAKPAPQLSPERQVLATIQGWIKAWQSKNLGRYISYYAKSFKADDKNLRQWRRHKAYLNKVYREIEVSARDLKISVKGSRAEVSFVQHYRSDWHRDVGKKHLVLVNRGGRWRIVSETWQSLPGRAGGKAGHGSRSS